MLSGLIARGKGRKESIQAYYFSRPRISSKALQKRTEKLATTQKSHRTDRQSNQISLHRVTECLTQINNKRGSISSRIVLIPLSKRLTEKNLKQNYFSNQDNGTDLGARTAELYSKQGNTDVTELVDIDETAQFEKCNKLSAKESSFCACGVILQELSAEQKKTLKEATAQVMIRSSGLQWLGGTRDLTKHLSQAATEHQETKQ